MDDAYILDKIYRSSLVRDNDLYQDLEKEGKVININGDIRNKIDTIYRSNKKYGVYQYPRKNGEIRNVNGNVIVPDILDTFDIDMMFNGNESEENEELSPLEIGLKNIWNYWMEHMIHTYFGLSATEELKEDIEEIKDNYDNKMYWEAAKVIEKNVEQYELLARENGSREKAKHLNYIRIMFDDVEKLIQIHYIYKKKVTINEKTTEEIDKTAKEYLMRSE